MVIVCTTCNAENSKDAVFCEECGIKLNGETMSSVPDTFAATQPTDPGIAQSESPADIQEPFVEGPGGEDQEEAFLEPLDDELTNLESQESASGSQELDTSNVESASLNLIEFGNPTSTVIPLNSSPVAVGKFDPSQGPIDIDLGHLAGNEYISRRHAELYFDEGWIVRDLGSTNGVFIRRQGQSDFLPRLQTTFRLKDGDEVAFGNMRFIFQEANG